MSTVTRRAGFLVALWLGVMLRLTAALAQGSSPPSPEPTAKAPAPGEAEGSSARREGKHYFTQGVALFHDGNYNGALAEFQASYKAHPTPGLRYNIALAQKALFLYDEAIASLSAYLAEDPHLPADRRAGVEQMIGELNALVADVNLRVTPPGATVIVDGHGAATAPLPPVGLTLRLSAGTHVIDLSADDHAPQRREVVVTGGSHLDLKIDLRSLSAPAAPPGPAAARPLAAPARIGGGR